MGPDTLCIVGAGGSTIDCIGAKIWGASRHATVGAVPIAVTFVRQVLDSVVTETGSTNGLSFPVTAATGAVTHTIVETGGLRPGLTFVEGVGAAGNHHAGVGAATDPAEAALVVGVSVGRVGGAGPLIASHGTGVTRRFACRIAAVAVDT